MDIDDKLKRIYSPMSETAFYILFCLKEPQHGYGIGQKVREITAGEVIISPGTMYGSLSKMEKDGLIKFKSEEDNRKIYEITELGDFILQREISRINRLYINSRGESYHDDKNHQA